MNSLFALFSIDSWKPVVTALLLPPVPLLLLMLVGARQILPRRWLGWLLLILGVAGLWLSCCTGMGNMISSVWLRPPPVLSSEQLGMLKAKVKARRPVTIVVLGSGSATVAPEYGVSSLTQRALDRLRYGLWLGRQTGATVGFSGGRGWSYVVGPTEAEVAAHIAAEEFGRPLAWTQDESRDTRQSVRRTVALLKQRRIAEAVLVTDEWQMPRVLAQFTQAAGDSIEFQAAPLSWATRIHRGDAFDWLPSADGFTSVRQGLRELLAQLAGD